MLSLCILIEKYIDNGGNWHVLQWLSSHHKYDKGVANKANEEYDGKGDGNDVEGQDANHHLHKISYYVFIISYNICTTYDIVYYIMLYKIST